MEPTMSTRGWMTDPLSVTRIVIGNYMVTDPNQSSQLLQPRTFISASGQHNSNKSAIASVVKQDLTFLLSKTIPDVEVVVSTQDIKEPNGEPTAAYNINIIVTSSMFGENTNASSLSFSSVIKDGYSQNHIYTYMDQ